MSAKRAGMARPNKLVAGLSYKAGVKNRLVQKWGRKPVFQYPQVQQSIALG